MYFEWYVQSRIWILCDLTNEFWIAGQNTINELNTLHGFICESVHVLNEIVSIQLYLNSISDVNILELSLELYSNNGLLPNLS